MSEFRTCTSCGYRRGFHIYFKPFKDEHRLALICPECGQSYDFGLMIKGLRQRPHRGATFDNG
jgi:DNA-directed RNA polymerase subunit M/transcription elongation factor TFIIS